MPDDDVLLIEDRGAVRVLRMNRPAKMNALNTPLTLALRDALKAAEADAGVRALVLAGEGHSFCAGADLSEFKDLTAANPEAVTFRSNLTYECQMLPQQMTKPIVSAVQGNAAGGGAGLALACDMMVASEDVKLFYPEVVHGIIPAIVMAGIQRHLPRKAAFELVTTKQRLTAADLQRLQLVNRVAPREAVFDTALTIAQDWADCSPLAMSLCKTLFYRTEDMTFAQAMEAGRDANQIMRSFRDAAK